MTLAELLVKIGITGTETVKGGLSQVEGGIQRVGQAAERAGHSVGEHLTGALRNAGQAAMYAAGALGTVAAVAGTKALFDDGVEMDRMTRGLQAVTGSSAETARQLADLREVAKLPGLGLVEAIQGSINLQAAGISASLATRSLEAFGNALATVGKGKADLDGVTLALTQIESKGKVMAQDVLQIQERVPQIRAAMQAAFGTSDTQALEKMGVTADVFIGKVVTQLEKLPPVSGGAGNALENLGDKIKTVFLPVGQGLARMFEAVEPTIENLLDRLTPFLTRVSDVFNRVANSGALSDALNAAADGLARLMGQFGPDTGTDAITKFVARALSAIATLPTALSQAGQNVRTVFGVLKDDAGEIFRFLADKATAAAQVMAAGFATRIKIIRDELSAIPQALESIRRLDFAGAVAALRQPNADLNAGQGDVDRARQALANVAGPDLKGFGGLGHIPGLFDRAGEFEARIKAASDTPPALPEYGKQPGSSPVLQALEKQKDLLERVERNTGKTADALSLRRQATGGGPLGQIGVTPAELMGGGAHPQAAPFTGTITVSTAPAANDLERAIRKIVEATVSKMSGAGFRPRMT